MQNPYSILTEQHQKGQPMLFLPILVPESRFKGIQIIHFFQDPLKYYSTIFSITFPQNGALEENCSLWWGPAMAY